MKVRDIMTTPVVTIAPQTPVGDVARLMLDQMLSGLPVVDQQQRMIGIVTTQDIVTKHAKLELPVYLGILGYVFPFDTKSRDEEVRRALAVTASELMSENVRTIGPDALVDDAATVMVEDGVNPLPVLDDGRLVGIVSHHDILRLLVREDEDASEPPIAE